MSIITRHSFTLHPSSISIENDGDMLRYLHLRILLVVTGLSVILTHFKEFSYSQSCFTRKGMAKNSAMPLESYVLH